VALTWAEVESLMQPSYGAPEVTLATLFPPRPTWMAQAACRGSDQAAWFARGGAALEAARLVCAGRPVREICGDYAMADADLVGAD